MRNVSLISVRLLIVAIFCIALQQVFGQNGVAIATGSSATADNSAMLDIQSTAKGILIPRMTLLNRNAISSPATGLLIYSTDDNFYYYYTGPAGTNIPADWIILNTGGIGSTGGTANYIVKYNGTNGVTISRFFDNGTATGIGIGTASPAALIDINANGGLITAATGAGGNVNITGQNAAGSNQNGGSIVLTPGTPTGTGTSGVGIGTSSVPVGGIGAAILAITGAKSSNYGPHVQYTTAADNYPLFQQLNWNHGNVALIFDASSNSVTGYIASSNVSSTASSVNTPWEIIEGSGALNFNYDATPPAQGTSFNWTTGMQLNSSGQVEIPNLANTNSSGSPVYATTNGTLITANPVVPSQFNHGKTIFNYGAHGTVNSNTAFTFTTNSTTTQVYVKLWGAGGGGYGGSGGSGGFVSGVLNVAASTSYYVIVGQGGYKTSLTVMCGGGGSCGAAAANGGCGGGRSCIRNAANNADLVTAGGGGGSGNCQYGYTTGNNVKWSTFGGAGGGTTGGSFFWNPEYTSCGCLSNTTGGSQIAGGAPATSTLSNNGGCGGAAFIGGSGTQYTGGNSTSNGGGGGGGGGYWGGGGGNNYSGGGGGSSYVANLTGTVLNIQGNIAPYGGYVPAANNQDPDYFLSSTGAPGQGGQYNNADGADGFVVIYYYKIIL